MVNRNLKSIMMGLLLVSISFNGWAEETITLKELVQEALKENPQIKAARGSWEASKRIPTKVSTLPDPTFMFGIRNVGSRYSVGSAEMSMLEFSFTQRIPFPKKLSLLGRMAEREAEIMEEEYRGTLLSVIEKLKSAFYDYFYIKKSVETINKNIELLEKLEKTAQTRYEVGIGVQQDVWKAQLEISKLVERLEILKQMEGTTRAIINSILNRPPSAPIGSPVDFDKTALSFSLDELFKMAEENSPELKKYKHFKEREEINMKYSKFQYLPDFSLNFGIEERGSLDRIWVASIGIDIPLYFWGKTAGVKEAQWRVSSAEYSLQNVKEVLFAEITSAYLSATASERLLNLYKGEIIPRASAALEASIVSYSVGKVDFLTVVTNLITLLDYQLTYYQKLIEFEKAVARLEVLTGVQFATEVKSE